MAFVPIPGVVQVEMRFNQANQLVENVWYVQGSTSPAVEEFSDIGLLFRSWWTTYVAQYVSDAVILREIYMTDLNSETGATYAYTSLLPANGQRTSPMLPNNVTLSLSLRTNGRGRRYRGRKYHIGLCEDMVEESRILSTVAPGLLSGYQALIPDAAAQGHPVVVASRWTDGTPGAAGTYRQVNTVSLYDTTVDSQRRRLPGRGL